MIRLRQSALIAATVLAIATAVGVAAAPRNAAIPVTTTIGDTQDTFPLRVQSDLQGNYVHTKDVQSTIERYFNGTDWFLTTYTLTPKSLVLSNRRAFFDLGEPASADNPMPPFGTAYAPAHLAVKCSRVNVDMVLIPAGATAQCPGTFRFLAPNGQWYRLAFSPENYAEVERVNVTCMASDSSGCKAWQFAPSGTTRTGVDPNAKNLTKLLHITANGDVLADLGNYYVSFAITTSR